MSHDEAALQRICEEVGNSMPSLAGWRGANPHPFDTFAKTVARRYAATVGAGVPKGVRRAVLAMTEDAKEPVYGSNSGSGDDYLRTWWSTAGGEFEREEDALGVFAALTFIDGLIAAPTKPAPNGPFRVGRKVPRNVYEGDRPLFMAATEEEAARIVALLNAAPPSP